MIDTHCHITYDPLLARVDDVVAQANAAGVTQMITIGTSPQESRVARELAHRFPSVFAATGVHPHYSSHYQDRPLIADTIRELMRDPRVVAIGEMGLDRHYPDPPMDVQKKVFGWQLEIAAELTQPIIIHNREATDETIAMIRASGIPGSRFVFHCFTGNDAELDAILATGAMVSFTGITTFKSAATLAKSTTRVPAERLMVETDSPYLTPEPHRKVKANEPKYVVEVARFLARQRGMEEQAFAALVDGNARRFFGLPG